MKLLVEKHNHNDAARYAAEREFQIKNHIVTCPKCNAEIKFKDKNVHLKHLINLPSFLHSNRYESNIAMFGIRKNPPTYVICPCCLAHIDVTDRHIPLACYPVDFDIEVLKEGDFHITKTCDNCESVFNYDYRDVIPTAESSHSKYSMYPTMVDCVECPVCQKKLKV